MTKIQDIQRQKERHEESFEPVHEVPWGVIAAVDGSTSPPNRPNMTWVDMYNRSSSRLAVLNETTLKVAGTPVQLGPAPKPPFLTITGTYNGSLVATDSTTKLGQFNTPPHGPNHQYPSEAEKGEDATLIYQPAIQMLKLTGNGTNLTVSVQPLVYWVNGTRKVFPGVDLDLTSYVPATAGQTKRILVYLDKDTNNLAVVEGTSVSGAIPIPFPDAPGNAIPSDFVRLTNGQTAVTTATHIDEGRGLMGSGGAVPGGSDTQIQFNDGGVFGGDDALVWDKTNDILTITKTAVTTPPTYDANMALLIERGHMAFSQVAGEFLGMEWYVEGQTGEQAYVKYNESSETLRIVSKTGLDFVVDSLSVWRFSSLGEVAVNDSAADIDFRIESEFYPYMLHVDGANGVVSIGTASVGTIAQFGNGGIVFNNEEADRDFRIAGNGVTNGIYYDAGSNRLGVGTATPQTELHVVGISRFQRDSSSGLNVAFQPYNADPTDGNFASIGFNMLTTGTGAADRTVALVGAEFTTHDDATRAAALTFRTSQGGGIVERMKIDGNVGIEGTATSLIVSRLTTTQRDALTAVNGMILYNSTTGKFQGRAGGAWVDLH